METELAMSRELSQEQILYFLLCVRSVGRGPDMNVEGLLGRRE